MKKYIVFLMACYAVMLTACNKEEGAGSGSQAAEAVELVLTRAGIGQNTTFGFIAYLGAATEPATGGAGTYRYNNTERNMLIPCITGAQGQILTPYSTTGGMVLQAGTYKVFMYTPSAPAVYTSSGSLRIQYDRSIPLKVSTTYFSLTASNYKAYTVPASLQLVEMMSDFSFDFIRAGQSFTISDAKLLNVGTGANYHPLLGLNEITGVESSSAVVSLTPTGKTNMGEVIYATTTNQEIDIFPTDYTLESIAELVLKFRLGLGDTYTDMSVPIAVIVKPSMHYKFNITVTSSVIKVSYNAIPWNEKNIPSEGIGAPGATYPLGTFTIQGWQAGGDNSESIGV